MKRKHKKQLISAAKVGGFAATVVSIGVIGIMSLGQATPDRFGCYDADSQPQTVVLVDASTPRWDSAQARSLRTALERLFNGLRGNERLSFFTTEQDAIASVVEPRFHVCGAPRNDAELKALNAPEAMDGYLQKQRERLYEDKLAPELDALLSAVPAAGRQQLYESPIMEMIQSVQRASGLKAGDKLVIISDMLQFTESARFCVVQGDMPAFDRFAQRPVYQSLQPQDMSGVEVEILMLVRFGYGRAPLSFCASEHELATFWQDYFRANGAQAHMTRVRYSAGG